MTNHPPSTKPWSVRMADSVIIRNKPYRWHYEYGLVHMAIGQVYLKTGDPKYSNYIIGELDPLIGEDGSIATYRLDELNLDQICAGRNLFTRYAATGNDKYKKAMFLLREQLRRQPRTSEQGFWHKQIYPYQMWLDGVYMACPFYAQFGQVFNEPAAFDDVARQIMLVEKHTRDAKTGLLYHGWDESKQMPWADPATGCSPHFWGRAVGWYAMAIVDVLDYLPADHPRRRDLLDIFTRLAEAIGSVQDSASGIWYQVLDQGGRADNYLEASGSCMFVYAFAKAVRQGILPASYLEAAQRGYRGIVASLIRVDEQGLVNLERVCGAAGLGGVPYRDGSYTYYTHEKIVANDYKGVGPFILASVEMEQAAGSTV